VADVEVIGARQAQATLRHAGATAHDLTAVMEQQARITQRGITGVPELTGRLARSVAGGAETYRKVTDDGFEIGTRVPYGHYVFRGTRYMPARPPRIPDPTRRTARAVANHVVP